jgi:hypothetical protein
MGFGSSPFLRSGGEIWPPPVRPMTPILTATMIRGPEISKALEDLRKLIFYIRYSVDKDLRRALLYVGLAEKVLLSIDLRDYRVELHARFKSN